MDSFPVDTGWRQVGGVWHPDLRRFAAFPVATTPFGIKLMRTKGAKGKAVFPQQNLVSGVVLVTQPCGKRHTLPPIMQNKPGSRQTLADTSHLHADPGRLLCYGCGLAWRGSK